ncbi:MAG: hypothetical protein LBH97_05915 [Treponema sp.]|jgi:hypothetical protein|nr:hypothetical protein [Treponema sp.]
MLKTGKIFMLCGLGFLALSCATRPEAYKHIDLAVSHNDFEAGIEAIKKGQEGINPIYPEKNAVSLFLDKGLLEHYAGKYADSSQSLQEAERLIAEAYTKSASAELASYIANDNTKDYPGEDFEDIYINVFNALNYYNRGNIEGALVEIRKLTWSNGKLDMLGRKYANADSKAAERAMVQFAGIGFTSFPDLPRGKPVNFSNSALARYLGALFYLGEGNTSSARIEFEQLQTAFSANPNVYYFPFPQAAVDAQNVPEGKGRLNIISFTGLSPVKEEGLFSSIFPFFQNAVLWYPQFKLPQFVKRPSRISRIEVVIRGEDSFYLELLEDMGAVVEETYNARFGNLFFKTYIRTLLKYAAVDIAAAEAGRQKGEFAALLSAIAGMALADATEGADIRMSRYFPEKAYIGGINLDPGTYTVTVNYYSRDGHIASDEHHDVIIRMNRLNLIESISLK